MGFKCQWSSFKRSFLLLGACAQLIFPPLFVLLVKMVFLFLLQKPLSLFGRWQWCFVSSCSVRAVLYISGRGTGLFSVSAPALPSVHSVSESLVCSLHFSIPVVAGHQCLCQHMVPLRWQTGRQILQCLWHRAGL